MASLRSYHVVSRTDAGLQAYREQRISPLHRDLLKLLQQPLTVAELMDQLSVEAGTIRDLVIELAAQGWISTQDRSYAPIEPAADPDDQGDSLTALLARRPPAEAPAPPVSPAPAPIPAADVYETPSEPLHPAQVLAKTPIEDTVSRDPVEVHADEDADRRVLEAMGILKAPAVPAPPPAPRVPRRDREKDSEKDKEKSPGLRELLDRVQKR